MVAENIVSGTALHWQLVRFSIVAVVGLLAVRTIVMPATKFLIARRTDSLKTQASIQNFAGIFGGIMVLAAALQAGNFGGLVTLLGTITAALTVAIGFGMRDEVGSLVSGIFIQLDSPYVKGDYIKLNEVEGVVQEISLRTTTLKTTGSEKLVMPNRVINSNGIKNCTKGKKSKTSVTVKIPVKNVEKGRKILLDGATNSEQVLKNPEPDTVISKIEEEKAEVELHYWVSAPEKVPEVRSKILDEFSKEAKKKKIFEQEKKE